MSDPQVNVPGLFSGQPQYQNFCRYKELLPVRRMSASRRPFDFPERLNAEVPSTYRFEGRECDARALLEGTDTAALLALRDGEVRLEQYWLTGKRDVQWTSFSVAKSFVSALVGIAVAEGRIGSILEPISAYIEVEPQSAYDGVAIKDVLQMSSGARWSEDYSDPNAEIHELAAVMSGTATLAAFVATRVKESPPGTVCRYNSADTQALGALLVNATGTSLTDYMHQKLVEPLGFESDSYWLIDGVGMEMAFAGLNVTARDFAKLGELFRNHGRWRGHQIVPETWVRDSLRATEPHLQVGRPIVADHRIGLGYGYQWWLLDGERGEFSAIGVYNQFVFIDPSRRVTLVKLSANPNYGTSSEERTNREMENLAFLRAVAAAIG